MAHEDRRGGYVPPGSEKGGAGTSPYGQPHPSERAPGLGLARVPGQEDRSDQVYYVQVPVRPVTTDFDPDDLERMWLYNALYGGLVLLVGVIAIVLFSCFSLPAQQAIAWLLFISGVVAALSFLLMLGAPGGTSYLLLAILNLGTGCWLVFQPQAGVLGLALVLALWFILHGLFKFIMTCQVRHVTTWWAVLISAVVSLVFAVMALLLFPGRCAAQLGLFVGIDLTVTGFALFVIAAMAYVGKYARYEAREPLLMAESRQAMPGGVSQRPGQPPAGPPHTGAPGARPPQPGSNV